MSLKPVKYSERQKEQSRLQAKMEKRKKDNNIALLPPYMYIISEGTKTEPYYIESLAQRINKKYFDYTSGNRIKILGTGRNTQSLLDYGRKIVEKDFPQAEEVWLMYDKDDFPEDNFDNTQYSAEGRKDARKYHAIWSNESFELWLLLHFQDVTANIGRAAYIEHLKSYIPDYEKRKKGVYDILEDKTAEAIKRAKKQDETYGNLPPSQRCPATRVYRMVEELQKFL